MDWTTFTTDELERLSIDGCNDYIAAEAAALLAIRRRNLPAHLEKAWGNSTLDPRDKAGFCLKQSHKTPMIPWHNGYPKCLACGHDVRNGGLWL